MTETTCGHAGRPAGRGLCRKCYVQAWRSGTLPDVPLHARSPRAVKETTCGHSPHRGKGLCQACYSKAYYETNRDRIIAKTRAWSDAHPELVAAKSREWYEANRGKVVARNTEWRKANPEKALESDRSRTRRRRARIVGADADLTNDQWAAILAEFDHRCAYCNTGGVPMEQEHMTPLSKGGRHTASNVVPSCGPCNRSKSARTALEWVGPEWSSCG